MTKIFITTLAFIGIISILSFSTKNKFHQTKNGAQATSAVNWMSWEDAIAALEADKKAGRKGKKIFVDIYTDWCGWCKKMDKETFQVPKIAAYLNQHFYPVKFNAEQKENISFSGNTFKFVPQGARGYHELAVALLDGKMSYPTVVFLNEKVEMLQRVPGYLNVPTFDCILHYLAEERYLSTPWETFQKEFAARAQQPEGSNR